MSDLIDPAFWRGKKIFLTGHTGFKGSWLSLWLRMMGANVTGYALAPATNPNLFELARVADGMTSIIGDINDAQKLKSAMQDARPEIVLHMAAQPLVRLSYEQPVETFATNIMGTINVLEAVRVTPGIKAVLVISSDKCYENRETAQAYRETDPMGGHDPYSASKACTEIVTASYRKSFFQGMGVPLASARAGNVIGGGDWSKDRLVPDILNALENNHPALVIRNPSSTRPWQHVLEPLSGYLLLTQKLYRDGLSYASGWNFGPDAGSVQSVEWIVKNLAQACGKALTIESPAGAQPHEAGILSLDSTKAQQELGWHPRWTIGGTLEKIAQWFQQYRQGQDMRRICEQQIAAYMNNEKGVKNVA